VRRRNSAELKLSQIGFADFQIAAQALVDDAPVLAANDRLLRIQERRAKLLGIEAPQQIITDATVRYEVVDIDTDKLT